MGTNITEEFTEAKEFIESIEEHEDEDEDIEDLTGTAFDGDKLSNGEPLEVALLLGDPNDCGLCKYVSVYLVSHAILITSFIYCVSILQ